MQLKALLLSILLFNFAAINIHAQARPINGVFVQYGLSYAENKAVDGAGMQWGVGYQHTICKDRLRWMPSFVFGKYNSKGIDDATDAYFNTVGLKNNLTMDVLKVKTFSLMVGTGFILNYSSGLSGSAVDHVPQGHQVGILTM